jgi:hypothetical protein
MKMVSRFAMLVALTLASICPTISSLAVPQNTASAKKTTRGLELVLERDDWLKSEAGLPGFRVTLLNAGSDDLILNIGILLANGNKQYADAISFLLTDSAGKTWDFTVKTPGAITGRVDPFVLPLPAGASYTLPLPLNDNRFFDPLNVGGTLKGGTCTIKARYTGRGVSFPQANLDYKAVSLMPYWIGTVESNEVRFEAPGK